MTRADFLKSSIALAALSGVGQTLAAAGDEVPPPKVGHKKAKPRNRWPYTGIDWTKAY